MANATLYDSASIHAIDTIGAAYALYYVKSRLVQFIAIVSTLLLLGSCAKERQKVQLIVKTPLYHIQPIVDPNIDTMYGFLKAAAKDFSEHYKDYDVDIEVVQYSNERRLEEVPELLGTPKGPDINWCDTSSNIYKGYAVPLDDIVTEAMKDDIDEEYFRLKSVGGRLYTMPFQTMQMVLCYNKELFRKVGLEEFISGEDIVQSWTIGQWDTVLDTLKAKLPAHIYPMMMYAADEQGDSHIMLLLCNRGGTLFDANNNYHFSSPSCLAALKDMYDRLEKGYFPPHPESLRMLDCYELFMAGQLAIYCTNAVIEPIFEKAAMDIGFVNFPSLEDIGLYNSTIQGFQVFDNGDALRVKVAKDFVKYIYDTPRWLEYSATSIPVSKYARSKHTKELMEVQKYIDNPGKTIDLTGGNPGIDEIRKVFYLKMQDFFTGDEKAQLVAKELDMECNTIIEEARSTMRLHQ